MITYSKTCWGVHLLFRLYGSSALRCMPYVLLSGLMTGLLFHYWHNDSKTAWRHPYPYEAFASIVAFIIVFRSNFGYQRYWEGRTRLQEMSGRWTDACIQAVVYYAGLESQDKDGGAEYRETMIHLMSLLHGLAIQSLRGDWDLENLLPTQANDRPPPVDAAALLYFLWRDEAHGKSRRIHVEDFFVLTGTERKRSHYNRSMPLGVVGGVTSAELDLLGHHLQDQEQPLMDSALFGRTLGARPKVWTNFFGLSTGTYVPGAAERVQQVYSWVLQLLRERVFEDDNAFPAPISANCFHMLSEGLISFENARKLADTPFPFPWAQVVLLLLVMFAFTFPLVVVSYINRMWLALVVDIIAVQSFFALNEVARDLEDPFVFEPNDLPLACVQYQFNKRIQAGCTSFRPQYTLKDKQAMAQTCRHANYESENNPGKFPSKRNRELPNGKVEGVGPGEIALKVKYHGEEG